MTPVSLYNSFHLGDALCTAHLLRALAKANPDRDFWFFVNGNIIAQINEAVEDLPNLSLFTFESDQWSREQHRAINGWKNADDHWVNSRHRWDWAQHQLEHHAWTAKRLGLHSPFRQPTDLLFDYPALGPSVTQRPPWSAELIFGNSDPCSGQLVPMMQQNSGYMDALIKKAGNFNSAFCTQEAAGAICTRGFGHSVSTIGRLSVSCKHHVFIASGPFWCTMNVHNHHLWGEDRVRIVLLDNGEMLTSIPWIQQVSRIEEAEDILRAKNLI